MNAVTRSEGRLELVTEAERSREDGKIQCGAHVPLSSYVTTVVNQLSESSAINPYRNPVH